ncbi:retrovirus-related pol polyprotein from transposon TNT 1-94 [Tanacetum coccineum]
MNKDKKVRFAEHVTSSSNIPKQTDSLRTKDSNKPLLTSTGVNTTTSSSGLNPSGRTFTIIENKCPLTRFTSTKVVPTKETTNKSVLTPTQGIIVFQIVLWYLDFGCSKHMTGNRSQLINFVNKFLGTVRFRNDHIAKIMGYGDYQMGNVTISWVYYVEGLGHNLFSMGQFCDFDLEALKTKSWLWHQRLSYLNFDYITSLAKQSLVRGLPKLKYQKDHICSACALGKSKKHSYKPKAEDFIQEKLYLLHMDLCGPMKIQSINGRKYILVIVDDYSWFTWVKFLRSKG